MVVMGSIGFIVKQMQSIQYAAQGVKNKESVSQIFHVCGKKILL